MGATFCMTATHESSVPQKPQNDASVVDPGTSSIRHSPSSLSPFYASQDPPPFQNTSPLTSTRTLQPSCSHSFFACDEIILIHSNPL